MFLPPHSVEMIVGTTSIGDYFLLVLLPFIFVADYNRCLVLTSGS